MPRAPWLMTQSWHDLLFAHWRVDVSELRRVVPAAFELDLFDGEAWLGVVPFYMTNVGLRATPALPWISAFAELNVRTYVRVADRPGVYFFSLDAARWLAVAAARTFLNLPYYAAQMTVERHPDGMRCESARRQERISSATRAHSVALKSTHRFTGRTPQRSVRSGATPVDFRLAVKMPRTITHELKLQGTREPFVTFLVRPRRRCGVCSTTPQAAPPSKMLGNCVNA
jgi:hypothetical protein